MCSYKGFFKSGLAIAVFHNVAKIPEESEVLIILVITGANKWLYFLIIENCIGSRSQVTGFALSISFWVEFTSNSVNDENCGTCTSNLGGTNSGLSSN